MTRRRAWLAGLAALAAATSAAAGPDPTLVERGRRMFEEERFSGNGRTCATCHPADNGFTLDAAYVATLPRSDPLFVMEHRPELRGLDDPTLVGRLGLIAVHADGFDRPPVFRSVPHLLGLATSIETEPGSLVPPGGGSDLANATGWSGDGAPGRGALRDFAARAITEHLTRTLARRPGTDFRLPTAAEQDALTAYMLSLGRRAEIDISDSTGLVFRSTLVERGKLLFNSELSGPCALCHASAGSLNENGFNGMFDTGVARRPGAPLPRLRPTATGDGGFGASPAVSVAGRPGFGDGRFNTPTIVEAAATAPLFHDHSAASIEDAVRFYTTATFAESPEGQALPTIDLSGADVIDIAALLRSIGALDELRGARAFLRAAAARPADARRLIGLALADDGDAIRVLAQGPRPLFARAVDLLRRSAVLQRVALGSSGARARLLDRAVALHDEARSIIVR